ncbi:MAG: hypothetical protein DRQ61_11420 [Gammaproteobacteria bacterium]|nr:MAG: hypothetical protein DRQ61_11420 [Gammaproteobacteria bacterium]
MAVELASDTAQRRITRIVPLNSLGERNENQPLAIACLVDNNPEVLAFRSSVWNLGGPNSAKVR